jgi:hypothetical protein
VNVCLLKVEVSLSIAESDWAALEAGADDVLVNLLGSHCGDVCGAMICSEHVRSTSSIGHINRLLGEFEVIHGFEDSCTHVPGTKKMCKVQTDLDAHKEHVLLAAIGKHPIDDGKKGGRITSKVVLTMSVPVLLWDNRIWRLAGSYQPSSYT